MERHALYMDGEGDRKAEEVYRITEFGQVVHLTRDELEALCRFAGLLDGSSDVDPV